MTPEEQAELDALKAQLAEAQGKTAELTDDQKAQIKTSASIQRAFSNLKQANPEAAEYFNSLAQGIPATPPWENASAETVVTTPEDEEPWQKAIREQSEMFTQQIDHLQKLNDAKYNQINGPVNELRANNALVQAKSLIDTRFGAGTYDEIRDDINTKAGSAPALLQDPQGIFTLAEAVMSTKMEERGRLEAEARQRRIDGDYDAHSSPSPTGSGAEPVSLDGIPADDFLSMVEAEGVLPG